MIDVIRTAKNGLIDPEASDLAEQCERVLGDAGVDPAPSPVVFSGIWPSPPKMRNLATHGGKVKSASYR